jgi:hypothetical protein
VKKSSTSPQSRSHAWLKERGWVFGKTEKSVRIPDKTVPGGWRIFKQDLFGFVDIVAVHPLARGVLFVQVTANLGSHKTDRLKKIEEAEATIPILKAGNTIEFQAWRKLGPRGKKRWSVYRCQARIRGDKIEWFDVEEEEDEDFAQQTSLFTGGVARVPA